MQKMGLNIKKKKRNTPKIPLLGASEVKGGWTIKYDIILEGKKKKVDSRRDDEPKKPHSLRQESWQFVVV